MATTSLLKFEVRSRRTGHVQFVAEIEADKSTRFGVKVALAVKWALKSRANLSGADLSGADLSRADLRGADLSGADLRSADLRGADLSRADLRGADLRSADLSRADLSRADLRGADLSRANGANLAIARTRILPEGDLVGWKKCRNDVVVKLAIPAAAKRSHAFGRKCRAEFADVIEVFGDGKAISLHDGKTEYVAGQRVTPDSFDENWQEECSCGIHFFITRAEAEAYS